MNPDLCEAVAGTVAQHLGIATEIVDFKPISGGSINRAFRITCRDSKKYFVKSNASAPRSIFEVEWEGLHALRATQTVQIPAAIGTGTTSSGESYLVLEWIPPGRRIANFSELLGRQLAELHRTGTQKHFGLDRDNYIGSTPQPNGPLNDWVDFWWQRRMEFQFQLARQNGFGEALPSADLARFEKRANTWLGQVNEPPALIHGDLWSGNFLVGHAGEPVLIDPAVYYADRVAEFGMTTLFGGFDRRFYAAYEETWPLPEGWETRAELYRLYHLLNHLNLFGRSYLEPCLEIIRKYR